VTSAWREDILAAENPPLACRHCYRGIWSRQRDGVLVWEDTDRSVVCMDGCRCGATRAVVTHEPLPAGLRGAPAGLT
jgi:hypothetical protein